MTWRKNADEIILCGFVVFISIPKKPIALNWSMSTDNDVFVFRFRIIVFMNWKSSCVNHAWFLRQQRRWMFKCRLAHVWQRLYFLWRLIVTLSDNESMTSHTLLVFGFLDSAITKFLVPVEKNVLQRHNSPATYCTPCWKKFEIHKHVIAWPCGSIARNTWPLNFASTTRHRVTGNLFLQVHSVFCSIMNERLHTVGLIQTANKTMQSIMIVSTSTCPCVHTVSKCL